MLFNKNFLGFFASVASPSQITQPAQAPDPRLSAGRKAGSHPETHEGKGELETSGVRCEGVCSGRFRGVFLRGLRALGGFLSGDLDAQVLLDFSFPRPPPAPQSRLPETEHGHQPTGEKSLDPAPVITP